MVIELGLPGAGAPGPVCVDSQPPGNRRQPGPGWPVLDVAVVAVGPGPQHGFLDKVLGVAVIAVGEGGGQPQQGGPVLGVQAAEPGRVRAGGAGGPIVGAGSAGGPIVWADLLLRRTR
jgi:hypothetical protein